MPNRPPKHRPARTPRQDNRPSAAARGYGSAWQRLRLAFLYAHPICQECERAPANHVDHIVPRERGGSDHDDNLQALCHSCHSALTAKHDGGFGNARQPGKPGNRRQG